jgi:hypothetical protein
MEQLANVGSDVARAARWHGKDQQRCEQAFDRAVELLDLRIADQRWKGRRKELTRARELLCDAMFGGETYGSDLASLDRYFFLLRHGRPSRAMHECKTRPLAFCANYRAPQ